MKKTLRMSFIIILVFVVLVSITNISSTFAYFFDSTQSKDLDNITGDFTANNIVEVKNLKDLIIATKEIIHNDSNIVSPSDKRKTIKLMSNIELNSDLLIKNDAHINLNGFKIKTLNFDIYIKHTYSGSVSIYNGVIEGVSNSRDEKSEFFIITPNANIIFDESLQLINVELKVSEPNIDSVFNGAFSTIANVLSGLSESGNIENIESIVLPLHRHCAFDSGRCAYISDDIDLPNNYMGYNINIAYKSSNEKVLSKNGNVSYGENIENVSLTVTVIYNKEARVKTFNLHIFNKNNEEHLAKVALLEFTEYFEKYFIENNSDGELVNLYNLQSSVMLPINFLGYDGEYYFKALDSNNNIIDEANLNKHNFETVMQDNIKLNYIFSVSENVRMLKVGFNVGAINVSLDLKVSGDEIVSIKDNYTIANAISKKWYKGIIKIYKDSNPASSYNGYTKTELFTDVSEYVNDKVLSISYELINNIDYTYSINVHNIINNDIKYLFMSGTSADSLPNILQSVFLKLIFSFDTEKDKKVSVTVPIRFFDTDSEGDNIHNFSPYYNYFNRIFLSNSGGYTYLSFEMPFAYGSIEPIYYFDFVNNANGIVSQTLSYSGDGGVALSREEVIELSTDKILYILSTNSAKWKIVINVDSISNEDTNIEFNYRYKFAPYVGDWKGSGAIENGIITDPIYTSKLIIPGIIRKDKMPDINLYKYVYDLYNPNYDINDSEKVYQPINNAHNDYQYIISNWLAKEVELIDNTNNILQISNYQGIEYLKNVKKLILKGNKDLIASNTNIGDIQYVSGMYGLKHLDLSDCNLYDSDMGFMGLPSGNNNFLDVLQSLINLEELHLQNNKIYRFKALEKFVSLKKTYVYNNAFDEKTVIGINIGNLIYGTNGIMSEITYRTLYSKNIATVIRVPSESDDGLYFPDTSSIDDTYNKLLSIEYQYRLPIGADITKVYETLSINPRDYGIVNESDKPLFGGEIWSDEMSFVKVNENTFKVVYKYFKRSLFSKQEIVYEIEFNVERY